MFEIHVIYFYPRSPLRFFAGHNGHVYPVAPWIYVDSLHIVRKAVLVCYHCYGRFIPECSVPFKFCRHILSSRPRRPSYCRPVYTPISTHCYVNKFIVHIVIPDRSRYPPKIHAFPRRILYVLYGYIRPQRRYIIGISVTTAVYATRISPHARRVRPRSVEYPLRCPALNRLHRLGDSYINFKRQEIGYKYIAKPVDRYAVHILEFI